MSVFKIGDKVSVLNEAVRGTIVAAGPLKSKLEDEDGFVREYSNQFLVPDVSDKYRLEDVMPDRELSKKIQSAVGKPVLKGLAKIPEVFEIDLHYEALSEVMDIKTSHEILQKQLTACRSFVQRSIARKVKRIVIIHGKGEGVLKSEIHLYLNRLGSEQGVRLDFHDAPYHEYGIGGATEVIFY
jgi:DNA-nicking Smr family endonuclease